jgi:hypothetical protein
MVAQVERAVNLAVAENLQPEFRLTVRRIIGHWQSPLKLF